MDTPADLKGAKYVNLYTYRKNGTPVKTTVLALIKGDEALIHTGANSGKVKRLRARKDVIIQRSNIFGKGLGPLHRGTGEVLDDEALKHEVAKCCIEKMASYIWHDKILRKRSVIIRVKVFD